MTSPALASTPSSSSALIPKGYVDVPVFQAPKGYVDWDENNNLKLASPIKAQDYRVSSHFGNRCAPVLGSAFYHGAIDLQAKSGTPIYAMLDGKIDSVVEGSKTTTGTVRIDHGEIEGKKLLVSYGHMWDATKYFNVGDKVKKGDQVADVGSSGISNGAHLHMAVKYGNEWVDPVPLFESFGLDLHEGATSVVDRKNPTVCKDMYVSADMGLKKSTKLQSETLTVLKRNDRITVTPGPSVNGYIPVKVQKTGEEGYLRYNVINNKSSSAPKLPSTSKTKAGVRQSLRVVQNIRSYPSTAVGKSGILDTLGKGDYMTTTGRTAGSYTEVDFDLGTGWVSSSVLQEAKYVTADVGLKKYANLYSDTVEVIDKNDTVLVTGKTVAGYAPVENVSTGKKGYIRPGDLSDTKASSSKLPSTKKVSADVRHTTSINQNVRSYPSTKAGQSAVLDTLKRGEFMTTTGRATGSYTEVEFEFGKGWIASSVLLEAPDPKEITGTKSTAKNVSYTPNLSVNLFSYPDSSAKIYKESVINLKRGAIMKSTGRTHGSYKEVTYNGKTYWAHGSYIHKTSSSAK